MTRIKQDLTSTLKSWLSRSKPSKLKAAEPDFCVYHHHSFFYLLSETPNLYHIKNNQVKEPHNKNDS